MKAFISYSHADSSFLEELKTNLVQLRRSGALQEWSDQEIDVGSEITPEIIHQLENSDVFMALLSPDYIASKYCYEKEFQKALELKRAGQLIIVPIICRPCDWKSTDFKDFLAVPNDGKPISEWGNRDTAFFNITEKLRQFFTKNPNTDNIIGKQVRQTNTAKSSRYVVQKDFDKIQKVEFLDKSFNQIVSNLKSYLKEISSLENVKYKILSDQPSKFCCILVNRDKGIAEAELSFTKSDDLNNRHFSGLENGDLNALIQSGNNEQKMFFILASDDVKQFFERREYMHSRNHQKCDPSEIGNELWRSWLQNIGVTIE